MASAYDARAAGYDPTAWARERQERIHKAAQRPRPSWNNDFVDSNALAPEADSSGRRHGTDTVIGRRRDSGGTSSRHAAGASGDGGANLAGGDAEPWRHRHTTTPKLPWDDGPAPPAPAADADARSGSAENGYHRADARRAHTCAANSAQEWGDGAAAGWEGGGAMLGTHSGGGGSGGGGGGSRPELLMLLKQKMNSRKGPRKLSGSLPSRSKSATLPARTSFADMGQPQEYADVQLQQCPDCGRRFNEKAFGKHVSVCRQVFLQKRKAFDAAKMRVAGTEMAEFTAKTPSGRGSAAAAARRAASAASARGGATGDDQPVAGNGGAKSAKWRQQSAAFREAIRSARMVTQAQAKGIPLARLPAAAAAAPDPSLVPCPHCARRFNEAAAERHIPRCSSIRAQPSRLAKGSGRGLGVASRKPSGPGRRFVNDLGTAQFTGKQKKEHEAAKIVALGGQAPKAQKMPYKILMGMRNKAKEREAKRLQAEKESGAAARMAS
ncbi:hypothetical protein JKP88DRAFT_352953 [Tribonema minus]|uniref:C2HC/C3H-type domain-containing protein n=1 Tax=Tribonema minus TaxID=303371 RepID=A0A835Z9Y9_9STRA|nr:hypothetical protein JKP88DRAFT_352953 [Tribonema minus]